MTQGIAKKQFCDAFQRAPWNAINNSRLKSSYPILDSYLAQQRISYFDYAWTLNLLRPHSMAIQDIALGLCHLILSAKAGHLCVKIGDHGTICPTVAQVWVQNSEVSFEESEQQSLSTMIVNGLQNIPSALITLISEDSGSLIPTTPLCRYGHMIYLQRHWSFESQILKNIKKLTSTPPKLALNIEKIAGSLTLLTANRSLLEDQSQAILKACQSTISLITGGPGTGKTYTVAYLIRLFWENLNPEERLHCEIALAAPTGKAASHLQKNVTRMVAGLGDFPTLTAKTLHGLLGIRSINVDETDENTLILSADLIIVDESSMIDVRLMNRLLGSIKEGARLILVGDQYQLPAVEAGSLFADFIKLDRIPCTYLKTCLRTELLPMLEFAQTINSGNAEKAVDLLNSNLHPCLSRLLLPQDINGFRNQLWEHLKPYFSLYFTKENHPENLLKNLNRFCLLSPLRKGPMGVDEINRYLWDKICSLCSKEGWLTVPIMIISNDYKQDLYNGEVGLLVRKLPLGDHQEDYGIFYSKEEDEVRKIPVFLLPKYEYAYCLSVHKSQGSEFDHVILIMPEGSELFGREVFYTAVTRARKQLEIVGSDTVITNVIKQSGERLSGMIQRMD